MANPYPRHDPAGTARYQELKQLARSQRRILAGTPGTLKQRSRGSTTYWVREYIRVDGRKDDEHIGTSTAITPARLSDAKDEVELARALAAGSSTLRTLGYLRVNRDTAAALAVLFNEGLFASGLTLVGSLAHCVLLNELGAIVRTQGKSASLELVYDDPSTIRVTLKRAGQISANVATRSTPAVRFLADDATDGLVLSPNQVIPVRLPSPERFVLHALGSGGNLAVTAALAAATEEETPGSMREAFRAFPASGKKAVQRNARKAARLLGAANAEAQEALDWIASR